MRTPQASKVPIAKNNFTQAFGDTHSQPHADQAAHGQAAEIDGSQSQMVEKVNHIACQLLDGVRTRGGSGLTVAASVIAQNTKAF